MLVDGYPKRPWTHGQPVKTVSGGWLKASPSVLTKYGLNDGESVSSRNAGCIVWPMCYAGEVVKELSEAAGVKTPLALAIILTR